MVNVTSPEFIDDTTASQYDVVVVGAGNAGLSAAISAKEGGAERVLVVERAPEHLRGGNSRFTAGAFRFAYEGLEDLLEVVSDMSESELSETDFGTYTANDFFSDMARVTQYRSDPDLVDTLVESSHGALVWLREQGVRFLPAYGRQAFKVDGKFKFWGGLVVEAAGGGPGLIESLNRRAAQLGIDVIYGSRVLHLHESGGQISGIVTQQGREMVTIGAGSVVLASGGFQANPEWRTRYLGPGWDLAKVRGTKYNTGDGISMAFEVGAAAYGNWSGAHAVAWELNAPEFGDLKVGDGFQKHSYPLGIMVNALGNRFVDEGADFRNYTYARYGHEILRQPYQLAWQVFDSKVTSMLRDEYRISSITKVTADSIDELAKKLEGVEAEGFLRTIDQFNASVQNEVEFNPTILDGRGTLGIDIPKSNWANAIDTPPFEAYAVTCGITFTFGGLRVDTAARVISEDGLPIPGLVILPIALPGIVTGMA